MSDVNESIKAEIEELKIKYNKLEAFMSNENPLYVSMLEVQKVLIQMQLSAINDVIMLKKKV